MLRGFLSATPTWESSPIFVLGRTSPHTVSVESIRAPSFKEGGSFSQGRSYWTCLVLLPFTRYSPTYIILAVSTPVTWGTQRSNVKSPLNSDFALGRKMSSFQSDSRTQKLCAKHMWRFGFYSPEVFSDSQFPNAHGQNMVISHGKHPQMSKQEQHLEAWRERESRPSCHQTPQGIRGDGCHSPSPEGAGH